ncbi:MAG TPA: diguanylate cyclase [Longimicrobiales bacterium]|nr:diguanylate cyclase [Longimicrobiales bacterium]
MTPEQEEGRADPRGEPDADPVGTDVDVRADIQPQTELAGALAEWLRSLVTAPDEAALIRLIGDAPPEAVGGGRLEYVASGGEPPTGRAATEDDSLAVVAVKRFGREAGWLVLRDATDPEEATAAGARVAGLLEGVFETLDRLDEQARTVSPAHAPEAYFEQLFSAAPEGIVVLDVHDRVVRVNRKFEEMFGYSIEEALGRTINELIVPPDLREEAMALTRRVASGGYVETESVRCTRDGHPVPVSILGTPVMVEGDQVAVYGIYRDISAQKAAEEALRRLSTMDDLTGLYNRRGFFMLAEQQRRLAMRRRAELLLLYIDIDDFKDINDGFGHLEGDRVLADIGDLLRRCYRDSDIVARVSDGTGIMARMGGDEFVVLAVEPGADGARILISRLKERLAEYNRARAAPYEVSLSIGAVTITPDPAVSLDSLLAAADRQMYEGKRNRSDS